MHGAHLHEALLRLALAHTQAERGGVRQHVAAHCMETSRGMAARTRSDGAHVHRALTVHPSATCLMRIAGSQGRQPPALLTGLFRVCHKHGAAAGVTDDLRSTAEREAGSWHISGAVTVQAPRLNQQPGALHPNAHHERPAACLVGDEHCHVELLGDLRQRGTGSC